MSEEKPLELTIHFTATTKAEDAPLQVHASVPDRGLVAGPHDFAIPLDDKVLADLRWYLEVYPQWPVGPDYDRALGIEAKLRTWGKQLFDAVFADREMLRVYDEFRREQNVTHLITLDATDPRVLQLPWELLADEGGYLFTQRPPISIRRRLKKTKTAQTQEFSLPMRILFVVSRPEGAGFLDPRSSAQALLDAIEPLGDQAIVEFLYPPTLDALTDRVRSETLPPVHVVHFDGHGVYVPTTGLGYLLFENDEHEEQLVNADDLGTLLNDTGVPLMILDACQTAQADKANPFGSVASKLIEAGIGSVLAMNYSVFVEATRLLTAAFYGALAAGKTIGQAVDVARFAMLKKPERLTLYRNKKEERIDLRDWFLPALYQQSTDPAPFAAPLPTSPRFTGGGVTATPPLSTTGEGVGVQRGAFPPEPRHGFHGRARELLHLQRTLAEKPIVVLHGYGGQGKTTLAAHAARWFTRTHRFERAVFVSFENGGGLEWALSEIGNALIGDNFAIHQGDPVEAIATALRSTSTLVVWDNFESILSKGNAPLPDAELQKLLAAGVRWVHPSPAGRGKPNGQGEGSRLIITTRDPSIPHTDFDPSALTTHTELPGLGRLDALELAGQILKDRGIARPSRDKLADLLNFLGYHPLSIQLVVPHLRHNTPEKLIAEFDELLPGFTTGAGKERNESLRVSLDFSLRRLGEETRKVLPDLAVFQGGGMELQILGITGFTIQQWRQVRDELARAALLSIDQGAGLSGEVKDVGEFTGYYVRFHPTLLPYLEPQLTADRRAELEACYAQAYYALARYEYSEDNRNPIPTRAIVVRELPNFRCALDLVLAAGNMDTAADFAKSIARFLDYFGRWSERDAMMAQVEKAIRDQGSVNQGSGGQQSITGNQKSEMAGGPSSTVTQAEFLMQSNQSERLWQMGRAAEAERVFRDLLSRLGEEPSYERALTFGQIGRCLRAQGRQSASAEVQRQELEVLAQLKQTQQVKREIGVVHTDGADVLRDMGQFDAARKEYEASLKIMREIEDDRSVTAILGQLGTLALMQNDLNGARRRYLEALAIFRANNEPQNEAVSWHMLGKAAELAEDWAEAERCHKEGLVIDERIGDKQSIAKTCNQLALVAEGARRLDEAERWYKRTLENAESLPDRGAVAYNNLANLYLAQNRLDEAEQYAHRTRKIMETLDLSAQPWMTYSILAKIAEKRGRMEEARQWRGKEQETYQAYVDRSGGQAESQTVKQWEPVIQTVVAACNGNSQAAQRLEPFLQKTETQDDWRNLIPVIRRIMQGERGVEMTEGLDRVDAAIVRRVLGMLKEPPSPTPPPSATGEGSMPLPQPPAPFRGSPVSGEGDEPRSGESGEGGSGEGDVIAQAMQQWDPVIRAVVAACNGNQRAVQELEPFLNDVEKEEDWRNLVLVIRRIMRGERGMELLEGLDPVDVAIVRRIMQLLNSPSSQPSPSEGEGAGVSPSPSEGDLGPRSEAEGGGRGEGQGITVEDILNLVVAGAKGDEQAGRQAYQIAQALQQNRNAPPDVRALGKGLQNILEGLRGAEAVQGLPPEAAQIVQAVLEQL